VWVAQWAKQMIRAARSEARAAVVIRDALPRKAVAPSRTDREFTPQGPVAVRVWLGMEAEL